MSVFGTQVAKVREAAVDVLGHQADLVARSGFCRRQGRDRNCTASNATDTTNATVEPFQPRRYISRASSKQRHDSRPRSVPATGGGVGNPERVTLAS